ncbi:NTP transferase domain-containing protein, partial [Peptostreptococcaceae bacterium OttesenSCG-928-C18]|nr:NTP transferase domain-containing protein [Peptostreptococcaceae bacterium OttesenSCG-928-C18]
SAIVLASGMSKRMKQNKLFLKLNDKMIFEYILDTIKEVKFDEVLVVTRFEEIEIYSKKLGYKIIHNKEYFKGQASSIRLGVENAKKNNDYIFFVADQPLIKVDTINKILNFFESEKKQIIIPIYEGEKGNPIIFSKEFRNGLLALQGDTGGSKVTKENMESVKEIIINNKENMDIDTLEDYENIRREYER